MGERIDFTPTGKPLVHGTHNAYRNYRCRCDRCREFNTNQQREYQRRRGVRPAEIVRQELREAVRHGTQTKYRQHGCRCEECRRWSRETRRRQRLASVGR